MTETDNRHRLQDFERAICDVLEILDEWEHWDSLNECYSEHRNPSRDDMRDKWLGEILDLLEPLTERHGIRRY